MIPRRDPLNGFEVYTGGFNVGDKHYWTSAFYLGVWGYSLAIICLAFGLTALAWRFFQCLRSRKRFKTHPSESDKLRQCELIVALQFTVIALISTSLVFWGNNGVHKELVQTSNMLVTTSNDVLHQVEGALVALEASIFPMEDPNVVSQIQAGCERLNSSAKSFTEKLEFAERKVHLALRVLNLTMKVTASVMTSIVLIGLVCAMGNHRGFLIFITNDACQAMKDYKVDPKGSTLSKLLPCLDPEEATKELDGAKDVIKTLLGQANKVINIVNTQEEIILLNQKTRAKSIPVMPFICDPYGPAPQYPLVTCLEGTCPVQNFSTIFAPYRCKNDNLTYCFSNKTPVPNQIFTSVAQSMNATGEIVTVLPKLHSIMTCDFISVAFEKLTMEHCDPLKTGVSAVWVGFAVASVAMLALQMLWLIICRSKTSQAGNCTFAHKDFVIYKGPYLGYS